MKGRSRAEDQEPVSQQQPAGDTSEAIEGDFQRLMETLQRTSDERDQIKDQLLRTMADFQNFRKRQEDQRRQLEQFATERLVTSLLPVLDNFERALASL